MFFRSMKLASRGDEAVRRIRNVRPLICTDSSRVLKHLNLADPQRVGWNDLSGRATDNTPKILTM